MPAPAVIEPPPPAQVSTPAPPAAVDDEIAARFVRVLAFLDKLRVLGVRSAGGDSKVLMSGRVYRLNDIVDYELALRLTGVTATTLTFVDDNGAVYTKNL